MIFDRFSGFMTGLVFWGVVSAAICFFMAIVVHGSTHGMGDGSVSDSIVLAIVILGYPISAIVGLAIGARR